MQTKVFSQTAPIYTALQTLAVVAQNGTLPEILASLDALKNRDIFAGKTGWQSAFSKLARAIESGQPEFTILKTDGNSKLPFVAFSTLPGVTCPGAGDCLNFCYSYRAWRYPSAFARQVQNAVFLRFHRGAIADAMLAVVADRPEGFDFRLYVDGDFSSESDVSFWMNTLRLYPQVKAYGYSKSFSLLLAYAGQWPSNYLLNISSGHNSGADIVAAVKALPITRGEFRAVSIGRKVRSTDHGTKETNDSLRAAVPEKIFACPGKCGSCTGAGHACGLPALRGRVIAIAMH